MPDVHDDLVADLHAEVGDALRSVATYDEGGYEFHHLRADVEAAYSEADIQAVYEDLVIQGISREYMEDLFHAGGLRCSIYGFDDAAMFHFIGEGYTGLFVSMDADVELNLDAIISTAKGAIEPAA